MSIIESIREFISGCPLLKNGVLLNVDRLGDTGIEYTIDGEMTAPILKRYTDGSSLRQFNFIFASRESYLPELDKYRIPQYIEVQSGGYVFDTDDSTARYQIQLKFVYYQDRRYTNG